MTIRKGALQVAPAGGRDRRPKRQDQRRFPQKRWMRLQDSSSAAFDVA